MALKFLIFAVMAIAVKAEVSAPAAVSVISDSTYDPQPQYYFGYDVQDALTGDSKTQVETRNGDVVLGQYSLNDPDGTRRIVDYSSDAINGFNAVVRKTPLTLATPLVATAALTPVVEPAAVRAAATPLVVSRALPVPAQPAGIPTLRSREAVAANPSPSPPLNPSPISRSSPSNLPSRTAPSSALPSSLSISTLNLIRSPTLLRSSNPLPSQDQPSANLPSIPQLRAALNSATGPSAPLGRASPDVAQSRSASLSDSVEINVANLESGPADAQQPPRNDQVASVAAPLAVSSPLVAVPRVLAPSPIAYAATPALTYSRLLSPVAYNVW